MLHTSTHYPANYGSFPAPTATTAIRWTCWCSVSEEIDPSPWLRCYPIGYISMLDGGKNDEKIIAIPFSDPTYNPYHDLMDLPPTSLTR